MRVWLACFLLAAIGTSVSSAEDISLVAVRLDPKTIEEVSHAILREDLKLVLRDDGVGYFYASRKGLELLSALHPEVLLEDVTYVELYALPNTEQVKAYLLLHGLKVIHQSDELIIVACGSEEAFLVHMLPIKKRLSGPDEPGLPLELVERAPARLSLTYSPLIQDLVNSVSQTNLYTWLRGLSGEDLVNIGGQPYRISTRYSPTVQCRMAAYYLREQFENLGLGVEFDYFGFRTLMKQIVFVDHNEGWAVGKRMTIIHTDDGGESWEEQYWGDEGALNDIDLFGGNNACVVGNNGIILLSLDGSNWQSVDVGFTGNINGVDFVDPLKGLACCDGGVMLKTVDGGLSWSLMSTGVTSNLYDIKFFNQLVGWAVGSGGRIIKTSDGGNTWQVISSPTTVDLNEIAVLDSNIAVVCGNNGTILRTVDGNTWNKVTTPTTKDLSSIFMVPDGTGWACGSDGTLIKSLDSGATWIDMSFSILYDLRDIFFFDDQRGWMIGLGYLSSTADGGETWQSHLDGVESGDINVVATLPGTTRPDDIYIICGHYDCISQTPETYAPGADDNGTGTIATLEAARVLSNQLFEATIRFVCFSREEQGLIGSKAYVREAYERGDNIVAALNFDMIGYADIKPEDVDIICNPSSQWLGDAYQQAVSLYIPDLSVVRHTAGYVGSDNSSFWEYGYSSLCGIEDDSIRNPNYHRTTDRVSTLDFNFYTKVVKGAVATLASLAVPDTLTSGVAVRAEDFPLSIISNPSFGKVEFILSAKPSSEQDVTIYDVSGRVVGSIRPYEEDGVLKGYWDGRDREGRQVSPGLYLISANGLKQKIVLLR